MVEVKFSRVCLSFSSNKNILAIIIMFFSIVIIYSVIPPLGMQAYVERIRVKFRSENPIYFIPDFKNWIGASQHLSKHSSFEGPKGMESSLNAVKKKNSSNKAADPTENVYVGNRKAEQIMTDNEFEEVEREMKMRSQLLYLKCDKYSPELSNTTVRYQRRQRFDSVHRLMYCENYKIGSSTWAMHFLHMNHIELKNKTPVHSFIKLTFPPLGGEYREDFLKKGTTFITVRDPFERLVSAYMDKLSINISRNDTTWKTFGKIQQNIKRNLREEKREGLIPTFEEFAIYLANVLSPDPNVMSNKTIYLTINNHWKPVYLNCAPCMQRYDIILKMETFSRDSLYLKQKLGLDLEVSFVRKGGRDGHIDQNRTLDMFNNVDIEIRRRLFEIYKYDFELFGYDWTKYFKS